MEATVRAARGRALSSKAQWKSAIFTFRPVAEFTAETYQRAGGALLMVMRPASTVT
jgi:hypothetical protein